MLHSALSVFQVIWTLIINKILISIRNESGEREKKLYGAAWLVIVPHDAGTHQLHNQKYGKNKYRQNTKITQFYQKKISSSKTKATLGRHFEEQKKNTILQIYKKTSQDQQDFLIEK